MPLKDITIKGLPIEDKPYKKSDGDGMFLLINPNGSKLWRFKYRYLGKEKTYAIGEYPLISLAEAREKRFELRKMIAQGLDPMEIKKQEKAKKIEDLESTFEIIANKWAESRIGELSDKQRLRPINSFKQHVFPAIGAKSINKINASDLRLVVNNVQEAISSDAAHRLRQSIGSVFEYGMKYELCSHNPANLLRGEIKGIKKTHHLYLELKKMPLFFKALNSGYGMVAPQEILSKYK